MKDHAVKRVDEVKQMPLPAEVDDDYTCDVRQTPDEPGQCLLDCRIVPHTSHGRNERDHNTDLQDNVGVDGRVENQPHGNRDNSNHESRRIPPTQLRQLSLDKGNHENECAEQGAHNRQKPLDPIAGHNEVSDAVEGGENYPESPGCCVGSGSSTQHLPVVDQEGHDVHQAPHDSERDVRVHGGSPYLS